MPKFEIVKIQLGAECIFCGNTTETMIHVTDIVETTKNDWICWYCIETIKDKELEKQ